MVQGSIDGGFRNPPVRWLMLAAPFTAGTGIYVFYASQPYLLELFGDPKAYSIAGLAAAILAGVQIAAGWWCPGSGGCSVAGPMRSSLSSVLGIVALALLGLHPGFVAALALFAAWAFIGSATRPMRQAFMNGIIPSSQRATVLSFDSLMGSAGGVVAQPALGRVADVSGYGTSLLVSAAVDVLALPFIVLARRERAPSDPIDADEPEAESATA